MSPQDEYRQKLNERYQKSRSDFKGSGFYQRWKELKPAVRFYIGGAVAFVVVVIVMVSMQ